MYALRRKKHMNELQSQRSLDANEMEEAAEKEAAQREDLSEEGGDKDPEARSSGADNVDLRAYMDRSQRYWITLSNTRCSKRKTVYYTIRITSLTSSCVFPTKPFWREGD